MMTMFRLKMVTKTIGRHVITVPSQLFYMNEQRLWQGLLICLQLLRMTLTFLITNKGSNEATNQSEYDKEHDCIYPGARGVTGLFSLREAKGCAQHAGYNCSLEIEYAHSRTLKLGHP